jgi:hypothetical protein
MRREAQKHTTTSCCPWDEVGLAPGLLGLIHDQGRRWEEDSEESTAAVATVVLLTRGDHAELCWLAQEAVAAGECGPSDGLTLIIALAEDDDELRSAIEIARGAWWREARTRAGGKDEPDLAVSVTAWPLAGLFPGEPTPARWQAWSDLASAGELGDAAQRVLRHGLRQALHPYHPRQERR